MTAAQRGALDDEPGDVRALDVLRRGLAVSPELRVGIGITVAMAIATAAGRLVIPILIQQILDRGIRGEDGFRPAFVYGACALAFVVVAFVFAASWATYNRLVRTAESTLLALRLRVFEHLHRLSLADHVESKKGVLTARVTSDIETLAQFAQWGAIAWVVNSVVIVGTLAVMAIYSWQLTLLVVLVYIPILPVLRYLQTRQFRAYEQVRSRVGNTLGRASEAVLGAEVIRAYSYQEPVRRKLYEANRNQFDAQRHAFKFFAWLAALTDGFSAAALSTVVAAGVWWGDSWGLTSGELVAFLFLATILLNPIAELGEILDQTQTAIAGWWKVLQVLDVPIEIVEPSPGVGVAAGALGVRSEGVTFAYRDGPIVLDDVHVEIAPGTRVAVVGETGSGKTTFAKLLARLADPAAGRIVIGDTDLREIAPDIRRAAIRMVPQDGFLFDATVGENVGHGRPGASEDDIVAAFDRLGLRYWLDRLPLGLATPVGERGASLSVGERQLIALARAQMTDPGLLILDEATSAVDPETEVALADALARLAEGRTTIAIAHRLSTAERADLILVFDEGRLIEQGHHDDLLAAGGRYAALYQSWIGNTRSDAARAATSP